MNLESEANKEDLYKAIFLSSSDESDGEESKETDFREERSGQILNESSEKTKVANESVVMTDPHKPASFFNTLRNTSPPRGIFANIDLDLINSRKSKNASFNTNDNADKNIENVGNINKETRNEDESSNKLVNEVGDDSLFVYGPKLPSKVVNSDKDVSKTVKSVKKIVEYNSDSTDESSNEWIESDKISKKHKSKKKKEKKVHKHKKSKKHKKRKH